MIPKTGPVTLDHINYELIRPAGQLVSFNDSQVRRLGDKASGAISFADMRGTAAYRINSAVSSSSGWLMCGWSGRLTGALVGPSGDFAGRTLTELIFYRDNATGAIEFRMTLSGTATFPIAPRGVIIDGFRIIGTPVESPGPLSVMRRWLFSQGLPPPFWNTGFSEVIVLT